MTDPSLSGLQPTPIASMKLPLAMAEITGAWLTEAIRLRHPKAAIRGFEIIDIMHGASTKIRIRPEYEKAGDAGLTATMPETMIVKSGFEPHSEMMKFLYAWEARFYGEMLPHVPLRAPVCYFAATDPNSHQSMVIMEDLRGKARFCSALVPQTLLQLQRRLSSLAALHAVTWQTPHLQPGGAWDWVQTKFDPQLRAEQDRLMAPEIWRSYVDAPRGAAASVRLHDAGWMRERLDALDAKASAMPYCLIHGDTHLGNLYEDGDTAGFFDFLPARAPWQLEISYHLGLALDQADWPELSRPLIGHYLAELAGHLHPRGIATPELDEAERDCAAFLPWGYFIFLTNETRFQTESVNTAYASRYSAAILHSMRTGLLDA